MMRKGLYEIKDSPIDGKGVFAKVNFRPYQRIGVAIEFQNDHELIFDKTDKIATANLNGQKKTFLITGDFGRYINHAWSPNDNSYLSREGNNLIVFASKFISRGTEILVNYDNNPHYLKPSSSNFR